jgi:hypothetical protein
MLLTRDSGSCGRGSLAIRAECFTVLGSCSGPRSWVWWSGVMALVFVAFWVIRRNRGVGLTRGFGRIRPFGAGVRAPRSFGAFGELGRIVAVWG